MVRPEGFARHFPVLSACPYPFCLLGKVLHFASQNCAGLLTLADAKKQDTAKAVSCFLVRPEGFEPPTF